MKTYEYYQPEYITKFQCDGSKCQAYCCRKHWDVTIDKKSYKKYSHLKPKSVAREITRNISLRKDSGSYRIVFDEEGNCPFLTDDKLCDLQKKYGEDFLSATCATYPRCTFDFGDFFERSLDLSCPIVAEIVLSEKDPLKFETVEIPEKLHSYFGKMQIYNKPLPGRIFDKFIEIQQTSVFILQERSLTIDKRLIMFGLYCDRMEELLNDDTLRDLTPYVEKLNKVYQNSNFLNEQVEQFSALINFDAYEHIKIMLNLLEIWYTDLDSRKNENTVFIDALKRNLKIIPDERGTVKISEVTNIYNELAEKREKFLQKFSTVLENYLVNELFMCCYPFRIYNTTIFNYGFFVTVYKVLEFFGVALSVDKDLTDSDLITQITWYAGKANHNSDFIEKVTDTWDGESDIVKIMSCMLQVKK